MDFCSYARLGLIDLLTIYNRQKHTRHYASFIAFGKASFGGENEVNCGGWWVGR
jgi:hypothetical protein